MFYGTECWTIRKRVYKIIMAKIRMLRCMWYNARKDKIKKWSHSLKGGNGTNWEQIKWDDIGGLDMYNIGQGMHYHDEVI